MIPQTRFRRGLHVGFGWMIVAAVAVVAGCSTSASNGSGGSVNHITAQGTSVSGWLTSSGGSGHSRSATTSFIAAGNVGGCMECHGADLLGGISRVSCMSNPAACHHGTVAEWVASGSVPQQHGASAKRAPGSSSMYACQICHGNDFAGTTSTPSCFNNVVCHGAGVVSPHPSKWRTSTGGASNHNSTDTANAPVCYGCHAYTGTANPNNPTIPTSPASAGTAPGCFNGTMCHNNSAAPHALGATWQDPTTGGSAFHGTTAKEDLLYCQTCHGTSPRSFGGGTGATTACTTCHTTAEAHPTDWQGIRAISTASISHRTSANRTAACGICHNVAAAGAGPNPSAPSCFSATYTNGSGQARGCHVNGPGQASHAVPFFDNTAHTQATTASFTSDCGSCHAVTGTSPVSGAPLCTSCHITDPRDVTNCTSCHANPPSGASTAYPNVGGAHSAHIALDGAGTPVSCSTCHDGLGSGTLSHYDRTRPARVSPGSVAFASTYEYDAKTGASAFDNSSLLRCTNVSCHGGQSTPNWQTGSITPTTQCTSCHASGSGQFNSYNSGEHSRHSGGSFSCTECHDMDVATNNKTGVINHFLFLGTSTMEGPAKDTFRNSTGSVVYTPGGTAGTGNCTGSCHSQTHSSESW